MHAASNHSPLATEFFRTLFQEHLGEPRRKDDADQTIFTAYAAEFPNNLFATATDEQKRTAVIELARQEFQRIADEAALNDADPKELKEYLGNLQQLFDPDQGVRNGVRTFLAGKQYEISGPAGAATRALWGVKGKIFSVSGIGSRDAPESTPPILKGGDPEKARAAQNADHWKKIAGIVPNSMFKKGVGFRLPHAAENAFILMQQQVREAFWKAGILPIGEKSTSSTAAIQPNLVSSSTLHDLDKKPRQPEIHPTDSRRVARELFPTESAPAEPQPFLHLQAFSRGCITGILAHNLLYQWCNKEYGRDISQFYKSFALVDPIRGPLATGNLPIQGKHFGGGVVKFVHTTGAVDAPLFRPHVYRKGMRDTPSKEGVTRKKHSAKERYTSVFCTNGITFPGMSKDKDSTFKPLTEIFEGEHRDAMHDFALMTQIREFVLGDVQYDRTDVTLDFRGTSQCSWSAGVFGTSQTNARFIGPDTSKADVVVDVVWASPYNKAVRNECNTLSVLAVLLSGIAGGCVLGGGALFLMSSPAALFLMTATTIGVAALAPVLLPVLIVLGVLAGVAVVAGIVCAAQSISLFKHELAVVRAARPADKDLGNGADAGTGAVIEATDGTGLDEGGQNDGMRQDTCKF